MSFKGGSAGLYSLLLKYKEVCFLCFEFRKNIWLNVDTFKENLNIGRLEIQDLKIS
jgi:hypothetical protein